VLDFYFITFALIPTFMTSRDPYAAEQYGRPTQYADVPGYNPYGGNDHQPHQTYDQEGYEPYETAAYRDEQQMQPHEHPTFPPVTHNKETNEFLNGPGEKSKRALKSYRYQNQGALWTKGGRGRCIGRFCCCTLLIALLFIISIVLSLLLWVRPPNINIGGVQTSASGSQIQSINDGFTINLGVNISVNNPNYFGVSISKINADIFYPINNTKLGNGNESNINFPAHSQTNFTFPIDITYQTSLDPSNKILVDIATKCGFIGGGAKSQITVNYKITIGIRIFCITISPDISNSLSFDCPISQGDISSLDPSLSGGT